MHLFNLQFEQRSKVLLLRFQTYGFDKLPIFELSQSEALQSVTSLQVLNLKLCFVSVSNLI